MKNPAETIARFNSYADQRGRSVFTISRLATGDPRLFARLEKRLAKVERDCQALERYMRDNPPQQPSKKGS